MEPTLTEAMQSRLVLEQAVVNLINDFEDKFQGVRISFLGLPVRYNGSNNASGKVIRLELSAELSA